MFAAGDVASFPGGPLGGFRRVEHEDHAKRHGRLVGANMAGAAEPYQHLPFFYSDLFDLGYEAVGELDSRLDTLGEIEELESKGRVCYVGRGRQPRGFLFWNLFGEVDNGRALLAAGEPVERTPAARPVRRGASDGAAFQARRTSRPRLPTAIAS